MPNRSRLINTLPGIQGIASPGTATIKLDVNKRYHKILLQTTSGASAPTAPTTVLNSVRLLVNGVVIRDITPTQILAISGANNAYSNPYSLVAAPQQPVLGEFPIYFTEPWMKNLHHDEILSWDMAGQSTFELQLGLPSGVTTPGITGVYEFDYNRNMRTVRTDAEASSLGVSKGTKIPFLNPVAQHSFTFPLAAGLNIINTLPISWPIRRIWMIGSIPGDITNLEIVADGAYVLQGTNTQLAQHLQENHFLLNSGGVYPDGGGGDTVWWDAAYITDPNQKPWYALKCSNSLLLRVTSSATQTLTVVMETLPGAYQS